jgi:6-phosphogluconolactonase (cycloisomerase 2 family)
MAPLFWVFLLTPFDNQRIITLGEKLHPEPAVEKFAHGDFNWIEFNPARRELYVVGLDTNFILAYNVDQIDSPPRKSKTPIDKSQSFAFNLDRQEIYIYNIVTRELLYFDAIELKLIRSISVPGMATGDVWINWNPVTDSITIADETDKEDGISFYHIGRENGNFLPGDPLTDIPATYITFHPSRPVLYFNSLRSTDLSAWDMDKAQITVQTQTSPRTERMTFDTNQGELLVASMVEGAILRYDAETLEFKGKIKTSPGDRTLAFDQKRNLLLTGNFIDNHIRVVDLNTHQIIESYYIGPWIRTITLDVENGVAYVSTIRGLFKLIYAAP